MRAAQIDHIASTTCILIHGIAARRWPGADVVDTWKARVEIIEDGTGWSILFEGAPILNVRFHPDGSAGWTLVESAEQLN